MAKATSKLQVTIPKRLAERFGITLGDSVRAQGAGDVIRVIPPTAQVPSKLDPSQRRALFDAATQRHRDCAARAARALFVIKDGLARSCTGVAALIDTNVSVSRYDPRFPVKQDFASGVLRSAVDSGGARISHQVVVEFIAATSRGGADTRLDVRDALTEAEEILSHDPIPYCKRISADTARPLRFG